MQPSEVREAAISPARRAMIEGEEEDLRSWVEGLGTTEMKFRVERISPKFYKGMLTKGFVANYEEPVYEDTIRENHGGGHYKIAVTNKRANGQWKYFTTRSLEIPGNPRIDNLRSDAEQEQDDKVVPIDNGKNDLAQQAMAMTQRQLERAQEREDRARTGPTGADPQMMQTVMAPLLAQLEGLQRQMMAKDAQILQLLTQKPEPPAGSAFQERMLGSMLENESVRIESMRARHESEIRQLKDGHQQDLNRIHDNAKEELRVRERQHERELEMFTASSKSAADAQKVGVDMRIDALKSDIARLNAENAAQKVEIAELRAKKEKSLPEQAKEIAGMQETFKTLGIGGKDEDDDSDKPWWQQAAMGIIQNPETIGQMVGGVRGAIAPAAAPPQPQLPPPGQPFQTPDGQVYVSRPDGKVQRLNPARRAKAAAAAAAVTAAKEGPRPPDAAELAMALQFMESACANGTPPEVFAASARSAIPGDIFSYLEKVGPDELLNNANLAPGSIMRSQQGRNWTRAVVKTLLEGSST